MGNKPEIPTEFLQEFKIYFPNQPLESLTEIDLAHFVRKDENIDEEAIVEILLALQVRFGMQFSINLRNHFPSWLSPMSYTSLAPLFFWLRITVSNKYKPLTILDIWEEVDQKRTL